jgi:hypothetical protein
MVDFNSGYELTIDGRGAPTTRTFDAYNPATRSVIAAVPDATREQLDLAVCLRSPCVRFVEHVVVRDTTERIARDRRRCSRNTPRTSWRC